MQKNYFFLKNEPTQNLNNMLKKFNFDGCLSLKRAFVQRAVLLLFLVITTQSYSQFPVTEYFEGGIPANWVVKSNLATPPINNNWISTASGLGYLSTKGTSVNPALNSTTGTQAEYYMITPQVVTPSNGEIRFYTKQGSVTNKGATYQVRISTASQPDISGFNVTLATWTNLV